MAADEVANEEELRDGSEQLVDGWVGRSIGAFSDLTSTHRRGVPNPSGPEPARMSAPPSAPPELRYVV